MLDSRAVGRASVGADLREQQLFAWARISMETRVDRRRLSERHRG
jgi:hypothetical protein